MKSNIEKGMYEAQSVISKWIGGLSTNPTHHPVLPNEIHEMLGVLLKPGDVLITRKEYAVTNYFLPGYWPHAALYLGKIDQLKNWLIPQNPVDWKAVEKLDETPHRVLESLKDGVQIRSINSPFHSDCLVILRPKLSELEIEIGLKKSLVHHGKAYDFDFDFRRSDRLVCTEVVYRAYEGLLPKKIPLKSRAGRLNVSAEDYLNMALKRDNFDLVAGFNPVFSSELLQEEALEKMLKKTLI
ncbi:hypothetical protein IPJ72_00670 [Candidatus Peregrinibacteria bacterium]|nr:MAG: hypothetical protein IPJ72_00670 [Candidatus Peregrinibacteria bacterium]